jgi:uncharacterized protein with GYD domain
MATYILTGQYSEKAYQGMLQNAEDRTQAVGRLFEAVGGKLLHYYITFGENDFLVIAEAPDNQAAMTALMVAAGTGGVRNLATTVAMSTADAMAAMGRAKGIMAGFKPAGA